MKAVPNDFATFEDWLTQMSRFGNGQTKEEADASALILQKFNQAKTGTIGRTCVCGSEGIYKRKVQCVATYPQTEYVFCNKCTKIVDDYFRLMKRILCDEKGEKFDDGY